MISRPKNELLAYKYDVPTLEEWRLAAGSLTNANLTDAVFNNSQEPQDILTSRSSTNFFGLQDMFGNVSQWCVSTNQQWVFIGGSVVNAKPTTRFLLASASRSLWAAPVTNADSLVAGFRETGFQCYGKSANLTGGTGRGSCNSLRRKVSSPVIPEKD